MAVEIASINSGSNGNCYYIGNQQEAVLIDVGLSCKEIEKRMASLGLNMCKVKAIFISHEHSDHIKGLSVLSAKYNLPVYISKSTYDHCKIDIEPARLFWINAKKKIKVGNITIRAFVKIHDAADPHSFVVVAGAIKVGVFTDVGKPCAELIRHFSTCHAAFLEANYDETMLENGSYPSHLKNRIRGGLGHLSNTEALKLFVEHRPAFMSHLFLSHLSKNNNDPVLLQQLFAPNAGNTAVMVASRHMASPLIQLTGSIGTKKLCPNQLSLFS
ncbi:MAG: MBL fold metallo-hydrolase [Ferruginibacter sp.]